MKIIRIPEKKVKEFNKRLDSLGKKLNLPDILPGKFKKPRRRHKRKKRKVKKPVRKWEK